MAETAPSSELAPYDAVWRRGHRVLIAGLVGSLGLVLGLAAWSAWAALVVPGAVLAGFGLAFLARHPRLHLVLVLLSFVVLFRYTEDITIGEIAANLFFLSFVFGWLGKAVFIDKTRLIVDVPDAFLALFLGYVTVSFVLFPFFDGDPLAAASQWRSILVLLLYFPIKHYIARDPDFLRIAILIFGFYVLFIIVRNALWYYNALHSATAMWEILTARSRMNERLLLIGMCGSLAIWLYGPADWRARLACLVVMTTASLGLLIGHSRVMMAAVPVGILAIVVLSDRRRILNLTTLVVTSAVAITVVSVLVLGDALPLILTGLSDRATSITQAHAQDLSLVNRFYEWRATWSHILQSPIVGRGLGVPYSFFSLEHNFTEVKLFTHNTYLGLLYRHGIIGFVLFWAIVVMTFVRGITWFRNSPPGLPRAAALGALAALPALAVAATMESTLLPVDGVFGYMYPVAILAGLRQGRIGAARDGHA